MTYTLLFRTGDAEIKGIQNTLSKDHNNKIIPLVELTRGRRSKNDPLGETDKRIKRITPILKDLTTIIDITTCDDLSNPELDSLYDSTDGYKKWLDFLENKFTKFSNLIPVILVDDPDEPDFKDNLLLQVKSLLKKYDKICYRTTLDDKNGLLEDLKFLKSRIDDVSKIIIVIDFGYIAPSAWENLHLIATKFIKEIRTISPSHDITVVATSFPKNVAEVGKDLADDIPIDEIKLHKAINDVEKVNYGDYGSLNPIRNDQIVQGWIPRIDVPLQEIIYYKRTRKKGDSYEDAYISSALKAYSDARFPEEVKCWGVKKIIEAAAGAPEGKSPSFWISVRMNIHIIQQLARIFGAD